MTDPRSDADRPQGAPDAERGLRRPLRLTRLGMTAERLVRAFWPAWTVALLALAALMMGLHDALPLEATWALSVTALLGLLAALIGGARRYRTPDEAEARARLDATLPGRPIAALADQPAVGAGDPASRAIWAAHQARAARAADGARAVPGDLRLASRDPYALRYVALTALMVAALFGSLLRATTVTDALPGGVGGTALATGPVWEGWIEPPAHTGRPSLYLADQPEGAVEVPVGSRVTLRLYGEIGDIAVEETVSGRAEAGSATDPQQSFEVTQTGRLALTGPGGAAWRIVALPDEAPAVDATGEPERSPLGEMRLPFEASDDFGVAGGEARVSLDLAAVERRHGLVVDPEPREDVVVDLPLPIAGDRAQFAETLVADLSRHPFAGLPVTITLTARDALDQVSAPATLSAELPGRRFFDPLARAVAEQRRDLLWSRENAGRVSRLLRAVSSRPEEIFDEEAAYLQLRTALRRLESEDDLSVEVRDEVAEALWEIAVLIEEGRLQDALERLREAQERLAEAMREGATPEEIAELMRELQEATDEYLRQLAQSQGQDPSQEQAQMGGEGRTVTQDELQAMRDRIQELMEQGRMAEAQELLEEYNRMMENMQVAEGQPGEGGVPTPGQQAMRDLQDTLREQQELSDEAFRDLQDGPLGQQPPQQGQPGQQQGQQGQQPGQQQGQAQGGQPQQGQPQQGQGQPGQQQGQGQQPGQEGQQPGQGGQPQQAENGEPGPGEGTLADRQRALRDQLARQRGMVPGDGSAEAEAAERALDRAEGAMDGAEDALREGDTPRALQEQADAMEALREGMRALGEQMAGDQEGAEGGEGQQAGNAQPRAQDPLGRESGSGARLGTGEDMLQDRDVYRRAQDLLQELRRRSADRTRPEDEREYYDRLLDRF